MSITRREAIVKGAATSVAIALAPGCASSDKNEHAAPTGPVDAGPLTDFRPNEVDDRFAKSHSFLVARDGTGIYALSSVCTHRGCRVHSAASGDPHIAIACPCHGSKFALDGAVVHGPAQRSLPRLAVERNAAGHLIVHPEQAPVAPDATNATVAV